MAREMKNSGVYYLGDIPASWKLSKFKYHASTRMGETLLSSDTESERTDEYNIPVYSATLDDSIFGYVRSAKVVLKVNDLVIPARGNSIGCATIVREPTATCTQTTICGRNIKDIHPKFLYFCNWGLKEEWYKFDGSAIPQITVAQVDNNTLALPPLAEQKSIADFLDAKCGEIDGLLADLDAEIKTLTEYKKSIIAETVTRGLNPNAPMKSSGIPWAESIPAHWTIQKGKYTFTLLQRPVKEDDGVITCFRDGEVTLRSNRREDGFTMSEKEYGYQGIEPGDLVVHGMDGFAGSIGISDSRGKATPVLNVLDSNHNKRYLMYYLRNMAYGNVFLALSTGIRVRSCDLSWKKLGEIRLVLPPMEEQIEIANYLDSKCAAIDQAITDKTQQIETLKAYKSSLIYEYVTGKKQVAI